jgi:hypothetical protein
MPGIFSFDTLKRKLASKQRSFREGCDMGGRSDGSVGRSFGRGRGDVATDPEEWVPVFRKKMSPTEESNVY